MKSDARVKYTKMILRQSLLTLLREKSIDKITISELCKKAEINRGTFYSHYATAYELLKDIEESYIADNLKTFRDFWSSNYEMNNMQLIFENIHTNRDIYQVLLGENGDPDFKNKIRKESVNGIIEGWQKEYPSFERDDIVFLFEFIFGGMTQLIINWTKDDQGISPEEMAYRTERIGHHAMKAIKDFKK